MTTTTSTPVPAPRVTLKPAAPVTGRVDGAWWPRSRDLSAELPALLTDMAGRWEPVSRVTYNLDIWDPTERRLAIAGRTVRLGGFHSQHSDTVTLIDTTGQRHLTLLVVPPETASPAAQHALTTAAEPGNDDRIDTLLPTDTTAG